jgi:hypothetical protein
VLDVELPEKLPLGNSTKLLAGGVPRSRLPELDFWNCLTTDSDIFKHKFVPYVTDSTGFALQLKSAYAVTDTKETVGSEVGDGVGFRLGELVGFREGRADGLDVGFDVGNAEVDAADAYIAADIVCLLIPVRDNGLLTQVAEPLTDCAVQLAKNGAKAAQKIVEV